MRFYIFTLFNSCVTGKEYTFLSLRPVMTNVVNKKKLVPDVGHVNVIGINQLVSELEGSEWPAGHVYRTTCPRVIYFEPC